MATILIVEDNKDLNQVYTLILERAGHTVITAFNGADALQTLNTIDVDKPDIILLDLIMPRKTGIEFLREAHLSQSHPHTKVLLFTNLDHSTEINAALHEGAYRCAIKARTTPDGLVRLVNRILAETAAAPQKLPIRHELGLSRFRTLLGDRQRDFE